MYTYNRHRIYASLLLHTISVFLVKTILLSPFSSCPNALPGGSSVAGWTGMVPQGNPGHLRSWAKPFWLPMGNMFIVYIVVKH